MTMHLDVLAPPITICITDCYRYWITIRLVGWPQCSFPGDLPFYPITPVTPQFRQHLLSETEYGWVVRSLAQFGTLARPSLPRESGPVLSWTLPWGRTMAQSVENSTSLARPCMESFHVVTDSQGIRLQISSILIC